MPFTLLVCGDLFNQKVNLELPFPDRPTIPELLSHAQNSFTQEMRVVPKPQGARIPDQFVIKNIEIYDDVLLKWVDLKSAQQLHEYDQLYCFQPHSPWQTDAQQDLPAPRPPTRPVPFTGAALGPSTPQPMGATPIMTQPDPALSGGYGAQMIHQPVMQGAPTAVGSIPPRENLNYQHAAMTTGLPQPVGMSAVAKERANVPLEERIRVSFQEIDEMQKGWIDASEVERAFRSRGIDFSANTVGELFIKADHPREGRIDIKKWHAFAQIYPNTVDAVYYRGRDLRDEQALRQSIASTQQELEAGRTKEQELRGAADAQAQHNQQLMQTLQDQESNLRSAADRRNLLEAQERALIEQEVKLERQKDALRVSVNKFKETADAFNRDAAQTGSPRRSREPATEFGL
eukprot:TRINITY_DN4145_c1_g1_i1.p1 TRINITY_DN4145_c1_g1~~TRINITY_DN4145_c1_g1_i1.p1  ORF type:complete len:434 (+),score=74.69 TRINITY_DN4145_c1_g1_i1:94-1302(+)